MSQFAAALEKVAKADYPPLEKVVIGLRKVEDAQGLAALRTQREITSLFLAA